MPQEALQEEEMQDDEVWRRPSELVPRQLEDVTTPIHGAATTRHDGRRIDIKHYSFFHTISPWNLCACVLIFFYISFFTRK